MFFLTPRYLKEAKHYRHALKRLINYKRDVLKSADLTELETLLARLRAAMKACDRSECAKVREDIDREVGRIAPPPRDSGIRENV